MLEILLSDDPSYSGHKDVLFAGFCGWVIAPGCDINKSPRIVKNCIASRTGQIINKGKSKLPTEIQKLDPIIINLYINQNKIDKKFLLDVYYPIEGISALLKIPTQAGIKSQIKGHSSNIEIVIACMNIGSYNVLKLSDSKKYNPASLNGFANILHNIKIDNLETKSETTTTKENWIKFRNSISFIYAAYHVKLNIEENLLKHLISGTAIYASHKNYIVEWIAKARYINNKILSKFHKDTIKNINLELLPEGEESEVPPPIFSEAIIKEIKDEFIH